MKAFPILLLLLAGVTIYSCQSEPPAPSGPDFAIAADNDGLNLSDGFNAVVVADSVGRGRHLAVRENGDIYVHIRNTTEEGHAIIAMRDTTNDGKADVFSSFAPFPGTGIEIHKNHVYYATKSHIYRSPLESGQLLPGEHIDTIARLEGYEGGHSEKTFAFDGRGNMLVNVGSLSNACMEELRTAGSKGNDPCVELETRAGIWTFNDEATEQEQTLEKRYATGIRNAVAIAWDPASNSLYAVQHGRDDLHRFWEDVFTEDQNVELPAEEFLQVAEGDNFGWPYCYYDQMQGQRFLNPEYGGDGNISERCEDFKNPLVGFPGHWAPNDILFYQGDQYPAKYKHGAFIAFHGSWNRLGDDQAGFKVVFVPMSGGKVSGDWEVFADGFIGAEAIQAPGDAKYRPCGLAEGPDGSLYICDSVKGRVWRIVYQESV